MRTTYNMNKFLEIQRNLIGNKPLNNKKMTVPDNETFKEILQKAKKGNEMATLQILEWTKCKPTNIKEKQVVDKANFAIKSFFDDSSK